MGLTTHSIDSLPPEVLGEIFNHISLKLLKMCRLVCHSWNEEIISHQRLSILLKDVGNRNRNVDFIRSVNVPKSLKVGVVRPANCKKLKQHSLFQLEKLAFSLMHSSYGFKSNVKFFSDHCHRLTSLEFTWPTLSKCDLEKGIAPSIQPYSLFFTVTKLVILNCEDYQSICCGKEIQQTSKNIQFLLNHIGTTKLVHFTLQINESYMDINCCTARANYHFEDIVLPTFISRQESLEELFIGAPCSMPTQPWTSTNFPTGLKEIAIESRSGDFLGGLHAFRRAKNQRFGHKELLGWNPLYYDLVENPEKCSFWKSLLLAQKSMESIYFLNSYNMGDARFLTNMISNNLMTLREIIITTKLSNVIDGSLFKSASALKELWVHNQSFDLDDDGEDGDCSFINVKYITSTLQHLSLRNVTLDSTELEAIPDYCHSLRVLQINFTSGHYLMLEYRTNFELIFKKMLRMKCLQRLSLGQFFTPKMFKVPKHLVTINQMLKKIMEIEHVSGEDAMCIDICSDTIRKQEDSYTET